MRMLNMLLCIVLMLHFATCAKSEAKGEHSGPEQHASTVGFTSEFSAHAMQQIPEYGLGKIIFYGSSKHHEEV
jgi:hypothetical protein